jgi:4-amino-4-deoxy-L-arabinose transferase-like glycosyltransferase
VLGGITLLGLLFRFIGLGYDLWTDEVATLVAVRAASLGDLLGGYASANQHTLNSILVWAGIRLLGESEWVIRLSAVIFGIVTIPVFYWLARLARFGHPLTLFGTLLLAVSPHHVTFSQNARGYAGYMLFSLLTTGALMRALETGRTRWIAVFVVASGLNFLSLLPSPFVFGAQGLVVGGLLLHGGA